MKQKKDLTSNQFFQLIYNAGWSPTSLARRIGCHHSMIYHIAVGRCASDRLLREISKEIGVPVEVIRPSIYLGDGPKKPGRPRHNPPSKANIYRSKKDCKKITNTDSAT